MGGKGKDIRLTGLAASPCKDCTTRFYGCHNVKLCKRWAEYVEKKKAERARAEEKRLDRLDVKLHRCRFGGRPKT